MWRLVSSELSNKSMYRGQKILYMGTIKAQIKTIYIRGQKVPSAVFGPSTKPIFRSESARYVLFIQMSKEMWDFETDGTGEIMFNKVINGFLPELFKRWQEIGARHLVSIVLFTRLEYDVGISTEFVHHQLQFNISRLPLTPDGVRYKDFYRVIVSDMSSGAWARILQQLKQEFKVFLRDVSIQSVESDENGDTNPSHANANGMGKTSIAGHPTTATRGNILEAIGLASSQFSDDFIDRDLVRTGLSIVVITPGTGVFEVDYNTLATTTDILIENGIGIDLVCLSRMPLHSVPLFKYRRLKSPQKSDTLADGSITPQGTSTAAGSFGSFATTATNFTASELSGSRPGSLTHRNHIKRMQADEWHYGIPHWVDVSFWTAPSDQGNNYSSKKPYASPQKFPLHKSLNKFVPRVRMYEIQMMGIMENEMSNISIPYLRGLPSSQHTASSDKKPRDNSEQLPSVSISSTDTVINGSSALFGSPKKLSLLDSPRRLDSIENNEKLSRWMEHYDDLVFRNPLLRETSRKQTAKLGSIANVTRVRGKESNASLLSTSQSSTRGASSTKTLREEQAPRVEKPELGRTAKQASSKTSITGSTPKNDQGSLKPTRLSRHISFGLRGFGNAAPKATASTELSSEHAQSASLLSRALKSQSSRKGKDNESIHSANEVGLDKFVPTESSPIAEKKVDTPQASPYTLRTQPTSPIAIRGVTAMYGAGSSKLLHEAATSAISQQGRPTYGEAENRPKGSLEEPSVLDRESTLTQSNFQPSALSPRSSMAPWLTVLNPSNPHKVGADLASRLGRWHHIFPRPLRASTIKWKSLCSPASIPLTTEDFPSADQLAAEYQENSYRVTKNRDTDVSEQPTSQSWLANELVGFRLSRGFQIVVGSRLLQSIGKSASEVSEVFDSEKFAETGKTIFMCAGSTIHQISPVTEGAVEIKRFTRRPMASLSSKSQGNSRIYMPAVRTMLAEGYRSRKMILASPTDSYDWNEVDSFIAGHHSQQLGELQDTLHFWRARFVLIPVDPPSINRQPLRSRNEDNEEEIRLEGIRRLTQTWQRYRFVPADERRFQAPSKRKDTSPYDIIYQTRNPSAIVAAELGSTLLSEHDQSRPLQVQLLPENELFERETFNLASLAQTIQGEKGIQIVDRRWHWRLHYHCFIGSDLTTWLLGNFRNIDNRDEAVELGNELMASGLFEHVERRHNFRDGNFFYQIASEYRAARPESRSSWFGSRRYDRSIPPTPASEDIGKDSPAGSRSQSSSNDDDQSDSDGSAVGGRNVKVTLSKSICYNVDHHNRSYRPELINLHFDRIHSPDNCFHIRVDWMDVTPKLIEDHLVRIATSAERFGLKLVELPIDEASNVNNRHPFRAPYRVKLSKPPPEREPQSYFDATSFAPKTGTDHPYQKALLKKFNFVLDLEAAKDFPPNVEVTYSWGKPTYRYSQYIHRSGVIICQITDDGDFLLLANRLYNNRSAAPRDPGKTEPRDSSPAKHKSSPSRNVDSPGWASPRLSPTASPLIRAIPETSIEFAHPDAYTPEKIKTDFETFCQDRIALERFYDEVLSKNLSPDPNAPFVESSSSIPALGLPPSLASRGVSPSSRLEPGGTGGEKSRSASGGSGSGSGRAREGSQ